MKKNFKLVIEYDGTSFFGWQRQKDKKTIQGEIESALSKMLNQEIKISGSGRTDAGVHAFGQVANFHATTRLKPLEIKKGLNSLIKDPIVIKDCHLVSPSFHAQYNAKSKEYNYILYNSKDPGAIYSRYQWHVRHDLNIFTMNECCKLITGVHDFKSFENTGSPRTSTAREVFSANIHRSKNQKVVFKICASGFLKYMVRNIMGTLVFVGQGKLSANEFRQILNAKDRATAGPTAPPQGLFLKRVNY